MKISSSIRFKFYTFIGILLLSLFLLLNIYPLRSSRDAIFEEKRNSLTSQGSAAASALSRLDRLTEAGIGEVLKLLDMDDYSRIIVTDHECTIIYDSDSGKDFSGSEDLLTALSGKTVFRSDFSDGAFVSSYTTPISSQNSFVGGLYIREYDTEQASIILRIQARIRFLTILICSLALVLTVLFTAVLMRRLKELTNSMRIVADGDYKHRLDVRGQDELSELGNEFNQLTERLDTTETQRRRFVSDASHELKTPLASIRLLSDSIVQSEDMDVPTMREFVTDIGAEAQRLQNTAEKLLDLSRMDDDIRIAEEPVDIKPVIVDALVLLNPLAKERNIKVRCSLDEGCVIMATADDVFHIVFNLMENAVKYNVNGGTVDVSLQAINDSVILMVSDTGIGIPDEDRLNIFSRFYRVDKARSREAGGSGLGLSIVHDAVQLHGGTITVGANKPCGSVFSVSFPRPSEEETGI